MRFLWSTLISSLRPARSMCMLRCVHYVAHYSKHVRSTSFYVKSIYTRTPTTGGKLTKSSCIVLLSYTKLRGYKFYNKETHVCKSLVFLFYVNATK